MHGADDLRSGDHMTTPALDDATANVTMIVPDPAPDPTADITVIVPDPATYPYPPGTTRLCPCEEAEKTGDASGSVTVAPATPVVTCPKKTDDVWIFPNIPEKSLPPCEKPNDGSVWREGGNYWICNGSTRRWDSGIWGEKSQ